jgi:nucleotide-binding universal stress UspA family protein
VSVLLAIEPGRPNTSAIELAGTLATALDRTVKAAIVVVVPPGVSSPIRTGMTDEQFGELLAEPALSDARERLGERFAGTVTLRERSVRTGLLSIVEAERPSHLVLGSAPGGPMGRIELGDNARGILNSCSAPVVLAPRGYRRHDRSHPLRRLNVAFGPDSESVLALQYAALLAERADTQLRTVTFWVRQAASHPGPAGAKYEAEIAAQWKEQMQAKVDKAVRGLDELALPSRFIHTDLVSGADWSQAMAAVEWDPGDLLIVGSSPPTGLRSVFLGSRSAEILRRATVPVAVLPALD